MAIQQHPLPQDISSYKFRLVGDMTLKQFLMLAVNIVLCIFIYTSPLPFFFRIPIAVLFLTLGIGLAFVPVQGRPLDKWLVAFIRSIYAPTQYRWVDRTKNTNQTPISTVPAPASPSPNSTPPAQPVVTPSSIPSTPQTPVLSASPVVSVPVPPSTSTPSTPSSPLPKATVPPPSNPSISSLPIPYTPATPNTIVGLTIDSQSKILDGVLIEIKTNGLTVRATKSNKLGQFMFARPLENSLYQISAEKENYTFDTYSLHLSGQIVNPLKIQAKS